MNDEINIVIDNQFLKDNRDLIEVFFNEDEITFLPENSTMVDVVMLIPNMFNSKSRARSNGFDKPIPDGFNDWKLGKKKVRVFCWKPMADHQG